MDGAFSLFVRDWKLADLRFKSKQCLEESNRIFVLLDLGHLFFEILKRFLVLGRLPFRAGLGWVLESKRELLSIKFIVGSQLIAGRVFLRNKMHFINDF